MSAVLAFRAHGPRADQDGVHAVALATDAGTIGGRLHLCAGDTAILWVFGAGGGLGGPAGGLYDRLGERLRPRGIASLELDYRHPARLAPCVADVLTGIAYLGTLGKSRVILVGHSFGGAVVIAAGVAAGQDVIAVAALSSQTAGADDVGRLAPRPVLFVHGEADEILPASCSQRLHRRAGEPKALVLYPGCRHGLDECRDALDADLTDWLTRVAQRGGRREAAGA